MTGFSWNTSPGENLNHDFESQRKYEDLINEDEEEDETERL